MCKTRIAQSGCFAGVILPLVSAGISAAIFAGLLIGAMPLAAQSLSGALASAYKNNPELLSARARLCSVDEGVPQALANWRPKVELSGDIARSHSRLNTRTANRDQIRTLRNTSLDLTQPLFRGLRTVAGVDRAENLVLAQRASLDGTEQDILLSAVAAYMAVVRDQAVVNLNIKNEQVLRKSLGLGPSRGGNVKSSESSLSQPLHPKSSSLGIHSSVSKTMPVST